MKKLKEQVAISTGGGALASSGLIPGGPLGNPKLKEDCDCKPKWKVVVDQPVSEEISKVLKEFLRFCQKKLQIQEPPVIYLLSKRAPGMTTGGYNPMNNTVMALSANRLFLDVLKTLAHELTHRMQDERGDFDKLKPRVDENDNSDLNTDYENEAYINSGNFAKEFCRLYRGEEKERLYSLKESLREEPEAETDVFGKYLFGAQRGTGEPNNQQEDELFTKFQHHFGGNSTALNNDIDQLADLERAGKYKEVLSVPAHVRYAYRIMGKITKEQLAQMLGVSPEQVVETPLQVTKVNGGTYFPSRPSSARKYASWAISKNAIESILYSWDAFHIRSYVDSTEPVYAVMMQAPIKGNTFLLNPKNDAILRISVPEEQEVISYGEVQCSAIWYMNILPIRKPGSKKTKHWVYNQMKRKV